MKKFKILSILSLVVLSAATYAFAGGASRGTGAGGAATGPRPAGPVTLTKPTTPTTKPDAEGFIRRWAILEPIAGVQGVTDSAVQAAVKTEYFPGQMTVVPKDGDKVTVNGTDLIWHVLDTNLYRVNLYHYSYNFNKPSNNVLWWAVVVVNCPEEVKDARLAIGSNDASVWWVNGTEVANVYLDRSIVIDDTVSKRLTLKKGPNIIRAAIHNQGGQTDFCARLLDKDDKPLTNYTISLDAAAQ
jgi:hypothetical protein